MESGYRFAAYKINPLIRRTKIFCILTAGMYMERTLWKNMYNNNKDKLILIHCSKQRIKIYIFERVYKTQVAYVGPLLSNRLYIY